VLKIKLTAINQYFLHARMLKHGGNVRLADYEYKASLEAMKPSDMLIEHILTQGGIPNLQALGTLQIGETPAEMLLNDLTLSETLIAQIRTAINFCESQKQEGTVTLLRRILENQQELAGLIRSQITSNDFTPPQMKDCA